MHAMEIRFIKESLSLINPVTKTLLPEHVVTQIKQLILNGELEPGQIMPTESELCDKFQVGRSTIREAKRALSLMGLIHARPGLGTIINENARKILAFQGILDIQNYPVLEVYQARKILEGELTALAALLATEQDIKMLDDIVQKMEASENNPEEYIEHDLAFHMAVARCAHNNVLYQMYQGIQEVLKDSLKAVVKIPGVQEKSHRSHEQTLEAIRSRDPVKAKQTTLYHLGQTELIIKSHLI